MPSRFTDYLTKFWVEDPKYIVRTIEATTPLFNKIRKEQSETPFTMRQRFGKRGVAQAFNRDSEASTLVNNSADYSVLMPQDSLVGIAGLHTFTMDAYEKAVKDNNFLMNFTAELIEDVSNVVKDMVVKVFYTPLRLTNGTPAFGQATLSAGNQIPASSAGGTFTLTLDTTYPAPGGWLLDINDVYDLYVGTNKVATVMVAGINDDRKNVTLYTFDNISSAITSGTAYLIIPNTYGVALNTYYHIASVNRTLHNIDSNTYPLWNGIVLNAGGTSSPLSKTVIRNLLHKYETKAQRFDLGKPLTVYTTRWQIENLESDLASSSIYKKDINQELKWGFGVQVDNVSVQYDPFIVPTSAYVPNEETLALKYFESPRWFKIGGSIEHPISLQSPQVLRVLLFWDVQYATEYPDKQARIYNLTGDFNYT